MCVCGGGGTVGEAVVGHSPSTAVFRYVFPTLLGKPCLITPSVTCNLADKEGHLYQRRLHLSTPSCKPIVSGSWMTPDLKACDFPPGLANCADESDHHDYCEAPGTRSSAEQ